MQEEYTPRRNDFRCERSYTTRRLLRTVGMEGTAGSGTGTVQLRSSNSNANSHPNPCGTLHSALHPHSASTPAYLQAINFPRTGTNGNPMMDSRLEQDRGSFCALLYRFSCRKTIRNVRPRSGTCVSHIWLMID